MPATRKLVSIRRISEKKRIKKSNFEQAFVDGWSVGAHKEDGFDVGELVVYFEIDSFVPSSDGRFWEYSDSFTEFNGKRGYHVRSLQGKGTVSQGLIFTLEQFPEIKGVLDYPRLKDG